MIKEAKQLIPCLLCLFLLIVFLSCEIRGTNNGNDDDNENDNGNCEPIEIPMTPKEIFESLKGKSVITYGWADMANEGAGLFYANPEGFILIDDETYPDPLEKLWAFIDANYSVRPNVNYFVANNVVSGGAINNEPKFIFISGDIDLSGGMITDSDKSFYDQFDPEDDYKRKHGDILFNLGSNTTIIGIDKTRLMFGGIRIRNSNNVIIRNITFWDAHGSTEYDTSQPGHIPGQPLTNANLYSESKASIDGLEIRNSDGIWVDHCKFTNGTCNDLVRNLNHDGGFDIPSGRFITVSWTEFTNIDKVMLVAGSDSAENAIAEDRTITLHHNYFHIATQRMPRTRGTLMHIYNNYYNNIGNSQNGGSFMGPGLGARFIVENNYFGTKVGSRNIEWFNTPDNQAQMYYSGNNQTDPAWWGRGNSWITSGVRPSDNKIWEPEYTYTLELAADLPVSIPEKAGPTLIFAVK